MSEIKFDQSLKQLEKLVEEMERKRCRWKKALAEI